MLYDVCLSICRTYIGPKSRTERPRKTKIGTEVAHVTRDSDTTFRGKRSKVNLQGRGILWRPPAQIFTLLWGWDTNSADGFSFWRWRQSSSSIRVKWRFISAFILHPRGSRSRNICFHPRGIPAEWRGRPTAVIPIPFV